MAWTYQFDEIDKEVTRDQSTPNRFTLNRYMYFKPDQYDNWSQSKKTTGTAYTAELVGNSNIPNPGTRLSGSLSAFYVNDIISISNLIENEHSDHYSYAVVTIEYENTPSQNSDATGDDGISINYGGGKSTSQLQPTSGGVDYLPPWEQYTDDFTVTTQSMEMPLENAFLDPDSPSATVPIATTAGQPLYGFNDTVYIQRITWSVNVDPSDNLNFVIEDPIINSSEVSFYGGKFVIPAGEGLLMPPNYKRMYWNSKDYVNEPYDVWTFEILKNPYGWNTEVLNAGTKAIIDGNLVDICTWYVYDPTEPELLEKKFGSFAAMMAAKKRTDEWNKTETDETHKRVWSGDFVQTPVPLTDEGEIDRDAIRDPRDTYKRIYRKYAKGTWNILIR